MSDPISGLGANAAAAAGLPANQVVDKQEFLLLFIEQLKNQDPLAPMEPDQLTAQLAQFSTVEQLTAVNDKLTGLADTTQKQIASAMLSMLGKDVEFEGDKVQLGDGEATGIHYEIGEDVASMIATIRNAQGNIVDVVDIGAKKAGSYDFVWDGKAKNGAVLPNGKYTVDIAAQIKKGDDPLGVITLARGTVDGVDLSSDPPTLTVNGQAIPYDAVTEVRSAAEDDEA
jgi:flagellar basal-body rod modification protein FlgD